MFKKYHVGEFISNLMEANSLTNVKLASITTISRDHIIKLRKGDSNLGLETAKQISPILGVSPSLLMNIQIAYLRYQETHDFLKKNKIKTISDALLEVVQKSVLSEKIFHLFLEKQDKYINNLNVVHYEPSKSMDAKNFILIQALLGIQKTSKDFDLFKLQKYLQNDFIENLSKIDNKSKINDFYKNLISSLKEFGVYLNIIKTDLNTTIKGISKIDNDSVKIIVENSGNFANVVFYITHELAHIINHFSGFEKKDKDFNPERLANELAKKLLLREFSAYVLDLNEKEIKNLDGEKYKINKYVMHSIWKYLKNNHSKSDFELEQEGEYDFYS